MEKVFPFLGSNLELKLKHAYGAPVTSASVERVKTALFARVSCCPLLAYLVFYVEVSAGHERHFHCPLFQKKSYAAQLC